jgi:hypothetical protein
MSIRDWPKGYYYQVECDRDCGTFLSECQSLPQAFDAMIEAHDQCRPTVCVITRRGRTVSKKRSRWSVWLHRGPDVEHEPKAA